MKNNSTKLLTLTLTSAVITALSIYSQSAAALDLSNPVIGVSYKTQGSYWGLFDSITVGASSGTTATVALLVAGGVEIPLPSNSTLITAKGNSGVSGGDRNIQGVAIYGQSTLNLGTKSTVASDGGGVYVYESSIFNADKLTINSGYAVDDTVTSAADRSGLGISDHSKVNLGQGSKITMTGDVNTTYKLSGYVSGVIVEKSSEFKADGLLVNVTTNTTNPMDLSGIRVTGSNASLGSNSKIITNGVHGVTVNNTSDLATRPINFESTDGLYIETTGNNLMGLNMQGGSNVKLNGTSTINIIGKNSTAVGIYTNSTKDSFLEADTLKIHTTEGYGLYVQTSVSTTNYHATATIGAGSTINANDSSSGIDTFGNNAVVNYNGTTANRNTIISQRSATSPNQDNLTGTYASMKGAINLKYTDITTSASVLSNSVLKVAGLSTDSEGIINGDNLTINVENSANPRYGISVQSNGEIHLTGDTIINVKGGTAIGSTEATYPSYPNLTPIIASGLATGNGKMIISGDVFASGSNALIDLIMQPNSLFTGGSNIDPVKKGTINLALSNSRWDMIKDSEASKLIVNNSTVVFSESKVGSTLTVRDLDGNNGTFDMMIDVPNIQSDLLIVTGTSAGTHHILATNQGSAVATGTEVIPMVQTADGGATFDLQNKVELGGYVYGLRKNTSNWELYSFAPDIDPATSAIPNSRNISTTADASANFLNSSYLMNYAETQTLLQRMGELRQAENSQGDAWVRAYSGKFDSFGSGKLSDFDMSYTGVQVGADKRLSVEGGDVYVGGMVGFAEADPKFVSGDGSLKSYNLGIYATYVAENDFYIDGVLKYTHMKNSFNNVKDTQGNITSGDTSSDGYGISLEVGKRFYLQQPKSGYYIEPQAQITFSHQGGSSTTASNGLVTSIDSYDSTLGRLSALVGYEVKDGANPMNVYFKTGVVTEMSGNTNYALNGSKESNDFGGSWWENGIGLTAQINKAHNLYVEGTYSTGSKFDQMQINAGYRYSF